jgi:Xaa-Pro aminopeptidase
MIEQRLAALRRGLESSGCDGFFSISQPANQYLTGFTGTTSAVVVTVGEAVFLCDFRYTEQAGEQVAHYEIEEFSGNILEAVARKLDALGVRNGAFDPAVATVAEIHDLEKHFAGTLVPEENLVKQLRIKKDQTEISAIRAASRLAEGVLADIVETLREGVLEREVAAQIEYEFKRRGASGASFDTIALFGTRSSLPHGMPGDRALRDGDIVLLDFGCRRAGYCSDLTRTYVFGTMPGGWFEDVYQLVREAQQHALEAVRPGMSTRAVDAVAREIITQGGHGNHFGHGLGHGVGIEIHEAPRLSPHTDAVLEEGMVVTVEPGIYVPGTGGVRIEDLVVVTKDGCDVLTASSKNLRVLNP